MRDRARVAVVLVMALCAAGARAQTVYNNNHPQHGWSLTIPQGWTQAPRAFVDACNEMVRERMPGSNIHYTGGFAREGAPPGAYPYILLQFTPADMAGMTYGKIAESMGAVNAEELSEDIRKSMSGMVSAVRVNTPVLDTANNRIMMRSALGVPDVGEVKGFSVSYLARDGLVQFHSYATAASEDDPAVLLQPFLVDFQLNDTAKFVPAKSGSINWGGVSRGAAKGAIIGAAVGLAYGVVKLLRRKAG